jgi:hypothetical protein
MEIITHRINSIKLLRKIPEKYGVEIDLRTNGSKIILNHESSSRGDTFKNYLENYRHGTLILNIKEAGIEEEVEKMLAKNKIKSYFLLDVEMPFLFSATKKKKRKLAVRFSEYESIETVKNFINRTEWIWVDTVTKLPINKKNIPIIKKFKSCIVCPERWLRKKDIKNYKKRFIQLNFIPDAVMTSFSCIKLWE